jgi:hypothetical protein
MDAFLFLTMGVVGTALFVLTFTIDGATRPGYHPTRHVVSALALGSRGWIQNTNFVVCGTLIAASAVGIYQAVRSPWLSLLVGVFGVSLVLSGIWRMDSMRGYPPGTPETTPSQPSRASALHDLAGFSVFGSLAAAAIVAGFTLERAGWSVYSWATGAALVVSIFAFGYAWKSDSPLAGLIQRIMILVGWTWLALLCLHLR